jgi:hypothetical protein
MQLETCSRNAAMVTQSPFRWLMLLDKCLRLTGDCFSPSGIAMTQLLIRRAAKADTRRKIAEIGIRIKGRVQV